jgi:hypothetical protein
LELDLSFILDDLSDVRFCSELSSTSFLRCVFLRGVCSWSRFGVRARDLADAFELSTLAFAFDLLLESQPPASYSSLELVFKEKEGMVVFKSR